jgi:hypothetical protein
MSGCGAMAQLKPEDEWADGHSKSSSNGKMLPHLGHFIGGLEAFLSRTIIPQLAHFTTNMDRRPRR